MKHITVQLRKGWKEIPVQDIHDWSAPIGALVYGARPEKQSSSSFYIYTYQVYDGDAFSESNRCSETIHAGKPNNSTFAGYNAFSLFKNFGCMYMTWIFLDVEDYISCIIITGTEKQINETTYWIANHLKVGEEIENYNGNPRDGGIPLVPPALLFQMVDFTPRDYEMTSKVLDALPSHFEFITRASMTPATDEEDLIAKVNQDYTRHYGFREIDYSRLSEQAKKELEQYDDIYIGLGVTDDNGFGSKFQRMLVVGTEDGPMQKQFYPDDDLYSSLSEYIESQDYLYGW